MTKYLRKNNKKVSSEVSTYQVVAAAVGKQGTAVVAEVAVVEVQSVADHGTKPET